jgi:hypothetical protein
MKVCVLSQSLSTLSKHRTKCCTSLLCATTVSRQPTERMGPLWFSDPEKNLRVRWRHLVMNAKYLHIVFPASHPLQRGGTTVFCIFFTLIKTCTNWLPLRRRMQMARSGDQFLPSSTWNEVP